MRRARTWCVSAAIALAASSGVAAQERDGPRYDLRAQYPFRVGDRVRVVSGARHEALVNVLRRGKPLRVENRRSGFELRYVDEVQALQPGDVRILRTYERVKDWGTGREDRQRRQVLLDYSGDHMSVERTDEELLPVARQLLDNAAQVPFSVYDHLIPDMGPIPIGHRWTIGNEPAAQLFLLDPAAIVPEGSACTGTLHSARALNGIVQTRLVFAYRLRFTRLFDITFDEPATLDVTQDGWQSANGAAPTEESTIRGTLTCAGRAQGAPADVTVQVELTTTGTHRVELLATTR
jgi:hypothetical protein